MNWQKASGYNTRSKVAAAISRYKRVIGDTLKSRHDTRRATGVAITIESINRMNQLGRKPPRRQDTPRKASMQQGLQARAGRGLAAFDQRLRYAKIPTAREAPSAIVISEMSAWSVISSFARAVRGQVSDGENAVALVNAKKR